MASICQSSNVSLNTASIKLIIISISLPVLEVYQFARDAAVAEAWLIAQEPYLSSLDLGHTIDDVENLIKKHEAFEKSAAAQEERFGALHRLTTVSFVIFHVVLALLNLVVGFVVLGLLILILVVLLNLTVVLVVLTLVVLNVVLVIFPYYFFLSCVVTTLCRKNIFKIIISLMHIRLS